MAGLGWRWKEGRVETAWRTVAVERGDLEVVVSCTGTLDAVTTVQVGTQVSGSLASIHVDFNDRVEAGQTIAVIDTTLLASSVREAEAGRERAEAEDRQAKRELSRIGSLADRGLASDVDRNQVQYAAEIAAANVKSARVALDRARRNLDYATIRSPISGTVIERNVDVGQTVAASLSAPQLFLIAADLSKLRILAAVDESDIGRIEIGQKARFNVQAWPDDDFLGTVSQVRLQSASEENVVHYTVVVGVENRDGKLLPGMTATVDFLVDRVEDVLTVSNAALRFRPPEDVMAALRERGSAERGAGQAGGGDRSGRSRGDGPGPGGGGRPANAALLFTLDESGELSPVRVRTGLTDSRSTQVEGEGLEEGTEIVIGIDRGDRSSGPASPFAPNGGSSGPPRRPPGAF